MAIGARVHWCMVHGARVRWDGAELATEQKVFFQSQKESIRVVRGVNAPPIIVERAMFRVPLVAGSKYCEIRCSHCTYRANIRW